MSEGEGVCRDILSEYLTEVSVRGVGGSCVWWQGVGVERKIGG